MKKKYSLWLMPSGELYAELRSLIEGLSDRYGGPRFEPHITLLGGLTGPEGELLARASELAAFVRPHPVRLTKVEYLDEYYRCLYIRVQETPEVARTHQMAQVLFRRLDDRAFLPHLSLLYGDFPAGAKEAIVEELGGEFGRSFDLRSIHLYATSGPPEDWYPVREFPLSDPT